MRESPATPSMAATTSSTVGSDVPHGMTTRTPLGASGLSGSVTVTTRILWSTSIEQVLILSMVPQ